MTNACCNVATEPFQVNGRIATWRFLAKVATATGAERLANEGGRVPVAKKAMGDDRPIAVQVEDLHKSFGPLEVLKGVSLVAREGDVVSMIGASGSGKSTFLRCINFLE